MEVGCDDIQIESVGSNHFYIMLREDVYRAFRKLHPEKALKKEERSYRPILQDLSKDSTMLRHASSLEKIQNMQNSYINFLSGQIRGQPGNRSWNGEQSLGAPLDRHAGNLSTMEGYRTKVGALIEEIAEQHRQGIDIILLHRLLCERLASDFNPRLFGSENFYEFLRTHYDKRLDFEVCESDPTGMILVFVYSKNSRKPIFDGKAVGKQPLDKKKAKLKLNSTPFAPFANQNHAENNKRGKTVSGFNLWGGHKMSSNSFLSKQKRESQKGEAELNPDSFNNMSIKKTNFSPKYVPWESLGPRRIQHLLPRRPP